MITEKTALIETIQASKLRAQQAAELAHKQVLELQGRLDHHCHQLETLQASEEAIQQEHTQPAKVRKSISILEIITKSNILTPILDYQLGDLIAGMNQFAHDLDLWKHCQ